MMGCCLWTSKVPERSTKGPSVTFSSIISLPSSTSSASAGAKASTCSHLVSFRLPPWKLFTTSNSLAPNGAVRLPAIIVAGWSPMLTLTSKLLSPASLASCVSL